MRRLSYLISFLMVIFIAACGGGGGSPGLSSGSVSAFSVVAPSAITLQVGVSQQYAIKGGVKPYSVFSTDPAVAVGWLVGEESVTVGTVVAGKATVTVVDAKGSKFDIAVTSGSSTAFYTTAATAMTITPGAAYAQTYTLGGGSPPYVATSSFPSIATVTVSGNQMTITGVQISAVVSNVTIRDAAGATLPVAVTVGTVPLAVNPTDVTAYIGDKIRAVIVGGTRPYRVQMGIDEAGINAQIVDGNILEVVGGQVVEKAPVTIVDANNQTVNLNLKLSAGQDVLRVQPSAMTIPESATTPDITIMVYGASVTGGIQVFTSDTTLLNPATPVKNVDGTGYLVKLTGGNTCSLTVVAEVPAIAGVDNTVPKDNDFTDTTIVAITQPTADVPPVAKVLASGGNRDITITAMDAKGKLGTSTITIKDSNGKAGC